MLKLAERLPRARVGRSGGLDVASGALWTARAFKLLPFQGLCVARSLVQHTLHNLDGTPSRLVVGVRKDVHGHGIHAHAWVSAPGQSSTCVDDFSPILVDGTLDPEGFE